MAKVSKDMIISDIISIDKGIVGILLQAGMHCIGCHASTGETLEDAGFVHGFDPQEVDQLVEYINSYLEGAVV
ncbi:MAG: DUF1858 domain-containing protein [Clostridiales bacterium]|nr:DUF1858 domain-containing protein [Clostridiales bacterium]